MSASARVGALVATGRLATVHRGVLNGRAVAVKRARPEVPGAAEALRREARILSAVSAPGVVPVLDVEDDPVAPTLVLGWADGGSLADLIADGPLDAADLLHLVGPLAEGLDALHTAGVAHLDVSPSNVLLAAAGPVLIDPAPPGAGTPGYADPAVVAGAPPSARSDVYGLAACAHVALSGRLARRGGGVAFEVDLPAAVSAALAAGLHPDPRCRPVRASDLVARLAGALAPAAPGAPVAGRSPRQAANAPPPPARTWPFHHWHEEAVGAEERRVTLASAVGSMAPARHRRRARLLVLLVFLAGLAAAAGAAAWRSGRAAGPSDPVRTSAHDSTQRPPAPRPPPTTTPGGRP